MKNALIIIDIQNDYFKNGKMTLHQSDEACVQAKQLLNHYRSNNQPVIIVQHVMDRPNAPFFQINTQGAEIHPEIVPSANEKHIVKRSPNAFINTDLNDYLKQNEISSLTLCGMMTHMCIDATTRAASDLGYSCTLIADACATKSITFGNKTVNATDVQASFLGALDGTYAKVISLSDYLS